MSAYKTLTASYLLVSALISQVIIFSCLTEVLGREWTGAKAFCCRNVFLECRSFCFYSSNNTNIHHVLSIYSVLGAVPRALWLTSHLIIIKPCGGDIILSVLQRRKRRFRKALPSLGICCLSKYPL